MFHGHGSIYRGTALALLHVGYWLTEEHDNGTIMTGGFVRGDPRVLRPMAKVDEPLVLLLEDGRRLPFYLRGGQHDGLSWEITAFGLPR
jgi:hypothetical protein